MGNYGKVGRRLKIMDYGKANTASSAKLVNPFLQRHRFALASRLSLCLCHWPRGGEKVRNNYQSVQIGMDSKTHSNYLLGKKHIVIWSVEIVAFEF